MSPTVEKRLVYTPMIESSPVRSRWFTPLGQLIAFEAPWSHSCKISDRAAALCRRPMVRSSDPTGPSSSRRRCSRFSAATKAVQIELRGLEALLRIFRGEEPFSTSDFLSRVGSRERLALDGKCRSLDLANASLDEDADVLPFLNIESSLVYRQPHSPLPGRRACGQGAAKSLPSFIRSTAEITEHRASSLPPFKLSIRPITSAFGHTPQSIFEYVAVLV